MDAAQLKRRLERIVAKTTGAERVEVAAWWGNGNADERRVMDDLRSGRLAWHKAHEDAKEGLKAVEVGDLETAELRLWAATDLYTEALESRIEPGDTEFLSRSAGKRGRPKKLPTPQKRK